MYGNESLLCDVMGLLAREVPQLGRSFKSNVESGNYIEARRAVHTLKSNARHVQLGRVAAYAEQLENLARDEQQTQLEANKDLLNDLAIAIADWADEQLALHRK